MSDLSVDEKFTLARSVGEECIQDAELRLLFEKKPHPVVYDGFEPSGRMHIAQGVLRVINVNKLTRCGCVFKVCETSLRGVILLCIVMALCVVLAMARSLLLWCLCRFDAEMLRALHGSSWGALHVTLLHLGIWRVCVTLTWC